MTVPIPQFPTVLVWIYNSNTGAVVRLPRLVAMANLKSGLGWHGPWGTKEEALAYYEQNAANNPGWKAPTGWRGNLGNAVTTIVDPFKNLNLGGWFIRIGEIILGIVLIGVGVAKLTGATNIIAKAAKVAIP